MPFSDPEGIDIKLVARFVREECIDYHECIKLDPTWAIHGNIYEGISEIYHKFRYWALDQKIDPFKRWVFFEIMEKDILPKDPTLTEIAKTIRHVSEETDIWGTF